MAGRNCARAECGKTVYPMEELKCLDQVWHKQCFRCTSCGMTLSMKNYKGYNKQPYCEAHYPKTTATVVVDTPEMRRLQEATKNQSLVKYHEEFERNMRGRKTELADDPEMQRLKKNTQLQSNVVYHGEGDKKEMMEKTRPPQHQTSVDQSPKNTAPTSPNCVHSSQPGPMTSPGFKKASGGPFESIAGHKNSPYTTKQQQQSTLIYSSELGGRVAPPTRQVGKIDDYDPLNGQWGSAVRTPATQTSATLNKQPQGLFSTNGSKVPVSPPSSNARALKRPTGAAAAKGPAYRAMYDYAANDNDEVSFKEGDLIMNCQSVDQGWMTGTVQRTGQWGMLPANYVEKVH